MRKEEVEPSPSRREGYIKGQIAFIQGGIPVPIMVAKSKENDREYMSGYINGYYEIEHDTKVHQNKMLNENKGFDIKQSKKIYRSGLINGYKSIKENIEYKEPKMEEQYIKTYREGYIDGYFIGKIHHDPKTSKPRTRK